MTARGLRTNFTINALGALIPLVVTLVTVPIYVHHIGDARYGVLSLIWVLLGYAGFLDLGLSRSATNALARLRDAPQEARARVLATSVALNLGFGLLGSFCLAASGGYLLEHVLTVPDALKPEIVQASPWIVGLFPLALVSGIGIGALESRERFLLANALQVCGTSLGNIVPVILVIAISPSLAVVIPAAVTTRALTVAAILIVVYREEGPFSVAAFDRHQARKLLSYGGWITVSGVIGPILTTLDRLLFGSMLGVAAVTLYVVPMNLATRSQLFAWSLARTLFPRMSSSAADEAHGLASRAFMLLMYGYAAICAPSIILAPVFFRFWIGADFASVAAPVAEILFFGAWINGLASLPYGLLQGQGRPDLTAKMHTAEVLPYIGVLWGLTAAFGITGAAVAWCLRVAVDAFCLFWAAGMLRGKLMSGLLLSLLLLAGSAALARAIGPNLWEAIGAAASSGVVGVVIAVFMLHDLKLIGRRSVSALCRLRRKVFSCAAPAPMRQIGGVEKERISGPS